MDRRRLLIGLATSGMAAAGYAAPVPFGVRLADAAAAQVGVTTIYDPAYVRLAYPGGDVPTDRGVCTDVVIRAYRAMGVDLQVLVHRDMRAAFAAYPKSWGLTRPDRNIDHRRVPNLEAFLRRRGAALSVRAGAIALEPGDLVSWRLSGSGLPHIGVASNRRAATGRLQIVHNVGWGTVVEDVLLSWPIVGWFRFHPSPGG